MVEDGIHGISCLLNKVFLNKIFFFIKILVPYLSKIFNKVVFYLNDSNLFEIYKKKNFCMGFGVWGLGFGVWGLGRFTVINKEKLKQLEV